ncbi:MAG: hypothetical protein ABFD54_10775 [Armatimonadota bacterium]|nr:hypothetical protein [bacterium]
MHTVFIAFVALLVLFVIWRYIATATGSKRIWQGIYAEVEPVIAALKAGQNPLPGEVERLACSPQTRSVIYRALREIGQDNLFPNDQARLDLIALSDLVVWLMHPNELAAVPDSIELVKEISRTEGEPLEEYKFFIFKFREAQSANSPIPEWMAGIAGPYWENDAGECAPPGVFSRFENIDKYEPEEHLRITEEMILRKLR